MYYFGCYKEVGHYLHEINYDRVRLDDLPREIRNNIDTGFCPKDTKIEGRAILHHVEGYTILSFWDNTIDKRPGSHSTYVKKGIHDFNEMICFISDLFTYIYNRYDFDLCEIAQ